MKAATESCSGKKVLSKFRQNPQKHPQRHPFSCKPQVWSLQSYQKKAPPPPPPATPHPPTPPSNRETARSKPRECKKQPQNSPGLLEAQSPETRPWGVENAKTPGSLWRRLDVYVYVYVCVYVYVYVYVYVHVHVYVYVYVRMYVCTYSKNLIVVITILTIQYDTIHYTTLHYTPIATNNKKKEPCAILGF